MAADETIARWTQNDLRRFIQAQLRNDPDGMLPPADVSALLKLAFNTNIQIDFGVAVATFGGASNSAVLQVPHKLGVAPSVVIGVGDKNDVSTPVVQVGDFTDITFSVLVHDADATVRTGTQRVYWAAIG